MEMLPCWLCRGWDAFCFHFCMAEATVFVLRQFFCFIGASLPVVFADASAPGCDAYVYQAEIPEAA